MPGSGRKKGTLNSHKITEKVKGDLLYCYQKAGGRAFLLAYLKEHPDEMLKALMRFLPTLREEPPVAVAVAVNVGELTGEELQNAAARIAFTLAASAHAQGLDDVPSTRTIEALPEAPAAEPVPSLPPSQEPIEEGPPVGLVYPGTAREQGRERPRRTHSITKRRSLL